MPFSKRILSFIALTHFLHFTNPSNLNQDTLIQGHQLSTTNHLISSSGLFTLNFFQSQNFYLGIRLLAVNSSYFWVANRDKPIQDPAGVLTIDQYGNMKIISHVDHSNIILYSAEKASSNNNSIIGAILLDTGNFMLREINSDGSVKRILWQSFDYPTNALIPGIKLGFDKKRGLNWTITSWRSVKSPMSGSFSLGLDPKIKQLVMWYRGKIVWSSGQWENGSFGYLKSSSFKKDFVFEYFSDENVTYVKYVPVYGWILLGGSGTMYGSNGNYSCNHKYFLSGCSMPSPPKCREHDSMYLGSLRRYGVMSRKGYKFDERENLSNFDCWMNCFNNCSCQAYSYVNQDETTCEIWSMDAANFLATNNFTAGGRQIYFIRQKKGKAKIWITSTIVGALVLIISCFTCNKLWRKHKEKAEKQKKRINLLSEIGGNTLISTEEERKQRKDRRISDATHIFDFQTILEATANFSSTNKIGEGGFGPVYKAWKLWNGGEALKLIDTMLDRLYPAVQVLRYIHIGLLCTQDQARDRPTMLEVVSFLSNEVAYLPPPKQPKYTIEAIEEIEQHKSCSINETTNSLTSGR
ncbi:hypothetical protein VNO77_43653 [Canavalia gladiata]|uniref:Uncharacterized protein n=1 Tax=Canavalia gladiata TaxID=3824 RepID=A0AAN9JWT8_CANGL